MRRWHRELAAKVGVPAEQPQTNRELLGAALRLSHSLPDDPERGDQLVAAPPLDEGSDLPAASAAGSSTTTSRKAPIRR